MGLTEFALCANEISTPSLQTYVLVLFVLMDLSILYCKLRLVLSVISFTIFIITKMENGILFTDAILMNLNILRNVS